MKSRLALGFIAALSLLLSGPASPQDAPQQNEPSPYQMGLGDLMNTLVQPRHAKLGLAGRAANWPLAHYALVELRQTFAGIAKAQPRYRAYPVPELIDAALKQPFDALEQAIKVGDAQKFFAAYDQLTQGCNACHASLDHAFVVIKPPDASAFPNQAFGSQP
jgi:hypothetical protein